MKSKLIARIKRHIIHLCGGMTKQEMPVPLSLPIIKKYPAKITGVQILDKREVKEGLEFFKHRLAVEIAETMLRDGYILYSIKSEEGIDPMRCSKFTLRATAEVIQPYEEDSL